MFTVSDQHKIGAFLCGCGGLFALLGVMLFFDRGLLALGNLIFLLGVGVTMGVHKMYVFFFQSHRTKGAACFLAGIFMVISGWAFFGFIVEAFGFVNLFGDFFPYAVAVARRLPLIGQLIAAISPANNK
eukprot:TRINITY_DN4946_c0_g1_i1.p1 TRINITY_DN4946_c0_g1~~TRINITY_DN4946_c0_g1_i1.p1  ORF type:complete len:129 (-),score=18.24 TRINITY_DN4946_c0_g1_i1:52-438(-)